MQPTLLDLFCGCGGFSSGFSNEFDIRIGYDLNPAVLATYCHNHKGSQGIQQDIFNLHSIDIQGKFGCSPDVIIGSPPCETFTSASVDRAKDPLERLYGPNTGRLTLRAIEIIGDLEPSFFVLENVVPISTGSIREEIEYEFDRVGIDKIYFNIISGAKIGMASIRDRVFISNLQFRNGNNYYQEHMTVEQAIGDLPDPRMPHNISNHELMAMSTKYQKQARRTRAGKSIVSFPGADGTSMKHLVRLDRHKLAPTVMGKSKFLHYAEDRLCTIREHARLMGYLDSFKFIGGIEQTYNQVGESVPPPMSFLIAETIRQKLE